MLHDWIFEVLTDLRDYAAANDLPVTAATVAEALRVAEAEIRKAAAQGGPPDTPPVPPGKIH